MSWVSQAYFGIPVNMSFKCVFGDGACRADVHNKLVKIVGGEVGCLSTSTQLYIPHRAVDRIGHQTTFLEAVSLVYQIWVSLARSCSELGILPCSERVRENRHTWEARVAVQR